jgi:hypothetical protein
MTLGLAGGPGFFFVLVACVPLGVVVVVEAIIRFPFGGEEGG